MPARGLICRSEECEEFVLREVHDPLFAGREIKMWQGSKYMAVWTEEHGWIYFSGRRWPEPASLRLPSEPWTFRVFDDAGGVILERKTIARYVRSEPAGPGCGFCTSAGMED